MRWSAEKLRWLSLGGALILAVVVAGFFGLARYSKGRIWRRILERNGVNLTQESNGITWSQSIGGRTVFTVHAARSIPHGNGHWTLRDAVLILYGKDGRNDRISGTQFEYDEKAGVLSAVGEVHLDLQAPTTADAKQKGTAPAAPLTFEQAREEPDTPGLIHVRTSGLVYVRKLGVAATKEMTEFSFGGITCTSRGAEFDSGPSVLRLLAEVRMSGKLHDAPFTLTAARADLDRQADTAELREPQIVSGQRSARAAHALVHMRKDGSLESGDADGSVQLVSATERMSAPRMHAVFGAEDRVQRAVFSEGVQFADTSSTRPVSASAQSLDLMMTPGGMLNSAVATGGVTARTQAVAGSRQMRAQRVIAAFAPQAADARRAELRSLHMVGAAEFETSTPPKPAAAQQPTLTRVRADDLTTSFGSAGSRTPEPQHMIGSGRTELQRTDAAGNRQISAGDALDVNFAERPGQGEQVEVASAVQTGHVVVHSWPAAKPGTGANAQVASVGYAQSASFEAAQGTLTLAGGDGSGRAEVDSGETQLRAPQILLHQGTADGEASGGVEVSTGGQNGAVASHVLAERVLLVHSTGLSEFFGSDAHPAQLWQAGSQVLAAKIVLDQQHQTMSARPQAAGGAVNAVFASARGESRDPGRLTKPPATSANGAAARKEKQAAPGDRLGSSLPEASRDAVAIRAGAMDYSDMQHQATFSGGVTMINAAGQVTGSHAAAFLQAPPKTEGSGAGQRARDGAVNMGGRLERMVVVGDVRVSQPGRSGTGEQLTYTATTNSFVLTGTASEPPRVRDAQRGTVTGTTLVFGAADSSIVVAGTHAAGDQSKPTRVHTETDIKQP